MTQLVKKIQNFINTDYFMILVGCLALFFWGFGWDIAGGIVMVSLACGTLLFSRDIRGFLIVTCYVIFTYSLKQIHMPGFFISVCIEVPLLLFSLGFFIYRNMIKPKIKLNFGKLKWGMLVAGIVCLIGGLGCPEYDGIYRLAVLGVGVGIYGLYFLALNSSTPDMRQFVCKLILYACLVIALQMVIFYIRQPDILQAFQDKTLRVGWGMSNSMAVFFMMGVPLMLYMAIDSRHDYVYILLSILFLVALAFTFSRGNILLGLVMFPPAIVYAFVKTTRKKPFLICFSILFFVLVAFLLIFSDEVLKIFKAMLDRGIDDNGRFEIYHTALDRFKQYPVFGIGFFGDDGYVFGGDINGVLLKWHSTLITIISGTGIVGLLGFVLFYFQRYRTFFKNISVFKLFAFLAVFLYEAYAMADLGFFIVYQIFFVFIFLVAAEKESDGQPICRSKKLVENKEKVS